MGKLITYRLALALPQLAMVSLLVFFLTYLVPGSPAAAILGAAATPESLALTEAELGLDQPLVNRLADWFGAAFTGDLGTSYSNGLPVGELVAERLPATLSLVGGGLVFAGAVGVLLGVLAALRPGPVDRLINGGTSLGLAIPEFWFGLVLSLVFAVHLGWVPVVAYTPLAEDPAAWFTGLILPSIALGAPAAAMIARQTRGSMAKALRAPYIDSLTAVGVPRTRIVLRYALKNAMIPVLASTGLTLRILIGASFVVEAVFAVPGMGELLLHSVIGKDYPVVQGAVLVVAVLVIGVNLVLDVGYGLLDPKVRPQ
ncbi:ABC transporter permease [Streptomyces sp. KLOTTS4A1]|uniref:ABC transporter permease n=1 Tax=Streptomyces sp. KLOTTS4A1 TaxID=3390996 RepID=UPI0039F60D2E